MAMLMPMSGTHRVFILDEAHQLTEAADNALLKTLEDPPSSAVFVLCTTEPQKIKATVRSRCQQIKLRRPTVDATVALLERVAKAEILDVAPGAFGAIAGATGGSLRDAVSLLDQLSTGGQVTKERVEAFAGETTSYFQLVDAVAKLDVAGALDVIEAGAFAAGSDTADYLAGLLDHLRQLLVVRVGGKVWGPNAPKIQAQSKRCNPEIVRAFAERLIPATDVVRRTDLRLLLVLAVLDMAERFHEEAA
jgi:DNA polymerase-3 subunit gamma/tau